MSAKILFISQPTLSRHIQAMEIELGYPLFNTSKHGIELTEYGKAAVRPFRKIVKEYQSFLAHSKNYGNQITGTVTLGLLYYAIDDYVADFLTYFKNKYPHAELNCHSYLPQALLDDLHSGKVDVATLFYFENTPPEGIRCQCISPISMVAVMRDDNPLSGCDTVTLNELSDYPLIELKDDDYSNQITHKQLSENKVNFHRTLQADNIEMVPMTVRTTGGIHITGDSCQRQNASSVVYKPIRCKAVPTVFGFSCLEDNQNPLSSLFLEEAQWYFANKQ